MPGLVLRFTASEGDTVKQGEEVMVLEAMKMENVMTAPCDGVVSFAVSQGDKVSTGDLLFTVG